MTDISLLIYCGAGGDSISNTPVVTVGEAPDKATPIVPMLVNEHNVWMISHAQDYILYSYYTKDFRSQDGSDGQCLFNLYINSHKQLTDGNSAMTVFTQLKEAFSMYALRGGVLPSAPVDATMYQRILSKFRVVDRNTLLPIMHGSKPASYRLRNQMELDAMMRFSRYQELSNISTLEMGMSCESTISFMTKSGASKPNPQPKKPVTPVYPPNVPNSPTPETQKKKEKSGKKAVWLIASVLLLVFLYILGKPVIIPKENSSNDETKAIVTNVEDHTPALVLAPEQEPDTMSNSPSPAPSPAPVVNTPTRDEAIQEILKVVNKSNLKTYRSDDFKKYRDLLNKEELYAIEAVLDVSIYKEINKGKKDKILQLITLSRPYRTIDEIKSVQRQIMQILSNKEQPSNRPQSNSPTSPSSVQTPASNSPRTPKPEPVNTSWMSSVQSNANSCPINYTYEIHVNSIKVTQTSITITVQYLALSMYEISNSQRKEIDDEISKIVKKYCAGAPSSVSKTVSVLDKAGRGFMSKTIY